MSVRLEGIKLALAVLGLVLTVFTLACSLAFSLGVLGERVDGMDERLVRIEDKLGTACRDCTISKR